MCFVFGFKFFIVIDVRERNEFVEFLLLFWLFVLIIWIILIFWLMLGVNVGKILIVIDVNVKSRMVFNIFRIYVSCFEWWIYGSKYMSIRVVIVVYI